jgi:single-strand DNA-binding protein
MQKITIIGRLGRDAVLRETQSGRKVIAFPVAVNGRANGVEKTSWYDVSSFNYERYQNMVKYLTKGSSVTIVGDLDADLETGSDGVTRCRRNVLADSIDFLPGSNSGSTQNTATKTADEAPADAPADEDMPRNRGKKAAPKAEAPAPQESEEDKDDLPF